MQVRPFDEAWATNYARQADDAFNVATQMSSAQLRALRPPLPQIIMDPPRFGYPLYIERQWDILQVFGITRLPSGQIPGMPKWHGDDRVDYSRSQGGYQGSDRNSNSGDPLGLGAGGN
jgi:hypothetical protein